ncbi:MAG: hypothetical protein ABJB01_02010 [Rudaea sp.]
MSTEKVYFFRFLAMCAATLLAGCATAPVAKDENSDVIKQRSVERWNFLIAHQAEKAYDYLSPGFRATKPRDVYAKEMNSRGVKWTAVSFSSKECEPETCKVRVLVDFEINVAGATGTVKSTSPLVETWIKVDGNWYYLPDVTRSPKLGGAAQE